MPKKTTQGGTKINPDHPCTSLICSRFINVKVALWVIEANDQRETMNPTNNITIYRLYSSSEGVQNSVSANQPYRLM
jgi:hypothetical protein